NEAFHEAVGDAIIMSLTPAYFARLKLLPSDATPDEQGVIDLQMKLALSLVGFLPFARAVDEWRWGVFSGAVTPDRYNRAWWELRRRYQGVVPPAPCGEEDFDPGAKFHVAANVPYARYFVARVLQFQLHRALCRAAGHTGPLHTCSIQGSREAG